jgi:hypothetical protein
MATYDISRWEILETGCSGSRPAVYIKPDIQFMKIVNLNTKSKVYLSETSSDHDCKEYTGLFDKSSCDGQYIVILSDAECKLPENGKLGKLSFIVNKEKQNDKTNLASSGPGHNSDSNPIDNTIIVLVFLILLIAVLWISG